MIVHGRREMTQVVMGVPDVGFVVSIWGWNVVVVLAAISLNAAVAIYMRCSG